MQVAYDLLVTITPITDSDQLVGFLIKHETPSGRNHAVRVYQEDAHGEFATHPSGVIGSTVNCPCGTTIEVAV